MNEAKTMTQIMKRMALALAALAAVAVAAPAPAQEAASDGRVSLGEGIRRIIDERNGPRPGQGIVIGVLGPDGDLIVARGTGIAEGVGADTLFEIGSITKVFTALLLADMVNRGEVSLDDPAAAYLPEGHRMPELNGRSITLRDLATHRSGLPRMADDMRAIEHPDGPFADYTDEMLLAFLDRHQLRREPGSEWEYSNIGMGLLGYLLERAAGFDYETLVRTRITGPLGMDDTMIALPPGDSARPIAAFDAYMRPVEPWEFGVLPGAGAIRSTPADMLIFARAMIDSDSPIAAAVETALAVRTPMATPRMEQALGWPVLNNGAGRELLMHDGQTAGFRSMLIVERATGRAVVALANTAVSPDVVDLAQHIFGGASVQPTPPIPAAPPPFVVRTAIFLPVADLEKFVGRYDFGDGVVIAVMRDGDFLYAQREDVAGAARAQILPEAPLAFFWKAIDAQIRFTDANGEVTGAVLIADGQELIGERMAP